MITAQEAQAQAILSQARVSIIGKYKPRVTKINLKKIFRRKGKAYDLWHTAPSSQHDGDKVIANFATAATASWLVVIVDDVTADRSSKMNTEMYRAKASAQTKYDPKCPAKAVQEFL